MRKPLPKEETPRSPFIIELILFMIVASVMFSVLVYMQRASKLIAYYSDRIDVLTNELSEYKEKVDILENELDELQMQDSFEQAFVVTQSHTPVANYKRDSNVQTIPNVMTQKYWDPSDPEVQNVTYASKEQLTELVEWIIDKRWSLEDPNHPIMQSIDTIMQVEAEYNISAITQLTILTWESGFCDIYRGEDGWPEEYMSENNAAGIDKPDGSPRHFDSVDECILYLGHLLRETYIDELGLETLDEIGDRYNGARWTECIRGTTLEYNKKLEEIINLSSCQ